jgi:hypothetical protein
MREGYWINYSTGKIVQIDEHETWIRNPKNAKMIGVPPGVHAIAGNIDNREKYLMFLMEHAPIMRVRGHGTDVAFEFHSRRRQQVMDSILEWGNQNAGPFTFMNIVNLATRESTQMNFQDFEKYMGEGGAEAVMRVAASTSKFKVSIRVARELARISRELESAG